MSENDKIVEVQLHPFSANMEKLILNSSWFSPKHFDEEKSCFLVYVYVYMNMLYS